MKATTKQLVFAAAMALLLAIGAGVLWGVAGFWAVATGESFWQSDSWYRNLVVRSDGTPLIESRSRRNYQNVSWTTLDGVAIPSDDLDSVSQALGNTFQPPHTVLASLPRLPWQSRIAGTTNMRRPYAMWYLVHDGYPDGRGYFVGYDSESKQCLGYIGMGGARDDRPPAEDQFPIRGGMMKHSSVFEGRSEMGQMPYGGTVGGDGVSKDAPPWVRHFISEGKVWRFDPRKRSVTLFVDTKDAVALGVVQSTVPPGRKVPDRLILLTF